MNCSDFRNLLDNYASLSEPEMRMLEDHAGECEECKKELEFYRSIIAVTASIPFPEPPKDLIEKVNKRIDSESRAKRAFNRIVYEFKNNSGRYASIAACLALGLVIGLNNSYIRDKLSDSNDDGVIREQVETTGQTERPVSTTGEKNTPAPERTENPAEDSKETADSTPKPNGTAKPAIKTTDELRNEAVSSSPSKTTIKPLPTAAPTKAASAGGTVKATAKPAAGSASNTASKPVATARPSAVTQAPASEPVEASEPPAATENNEEPIERTRISQGEYSVPHSQNEIGNESDENDDSVEAYSIDDEGYSIAMANGETGKGKQRYVIAGYDKVIVSSDDIASARSVMDGFGAVYDEDHYEMSYSEFYEFLAALQENGISYDYVQLYGGDNAAFKLLSK